MAVLNDFAFNGGTVPTHSGTGRPRILGGCVSPNEIFNHYGDSGRTDNLKKKKTLPNEKGLLLHLCAAVLTLDIEEAVKGSFFLNSFASRVGGLLVVGGCASKSRSEMWTAGRDTGSLLA